MEDDTKKRLIEAIEKIDKIDILEYIFVIVCDIMESEREV